MEENKQSYANAKQSYALANKCKVVIGDLSNQTDVKKKRVKTKQSAWFLTINSNLYFEDDDSSIIEVAKHFRDSIESLYSLKENLLQVITTRGKNNPLDYDSVKAEFQLEKSPDSKRLHAHGILLLIHRSLLQLSSNKMQRWIKNDMNKRLKELNLKLPKGIYVHFDYISADDWNSKEWNKEKMMQYIQKNKKFDTDKQKKHEESDDESESKKQKIEYFKEKIDNDFIWDLGGKEEEKEKEEKEEQDQEQDDKEIEQEFIEDEIKYPNETNKIKKVFLCIPPDLNKYIVN